MGEGFREVDTGAVGQVYAVGPSRPTGGAAAIAMLVGPDAPVAFESKLRGSHMSHAYDFCKPNLASEYGVFDAKLTHTCYLMALDSCYRIFYEKFEKLKGRPFSISDSDYFVFHSPYNKYCSLCRKVLVGYDFMRNPSFVDEVARETLAPYASLSGDESYHNRNLEKASQQAAKHVFDNKHGSLVGKRVVMYSYGSGLAATMFSFHLQEDQHPFNLSNIATVMNVSGKLKQRVEFPPEKLLGI